jgi:RNA polymerase sigma-70 factor (ECF subfamily)
MLDQAPETGLTETIIRAREGDRDAFGEIYRTYAVCLRMCADRDAADEMTQEVFIRLWDVIGSYRGESSFSTWLHSVTMNHVLGRKRSVRRRRVWSRPLEAGDDAEAVAAVAAPGSDIDLERAIGTLSPQSKAVFILHDVEGYHHSEIGKMLGIAEGTAKAHLHRARRLLRERLKG